MARLRPGPAAVPVIVISGMAGVGKSALAVHAAHLLRDRYRTSFTSPARNDPRGPLEPGAALGTLLRMLGVPDRAIPADARIAPHCGG